MFFLGVLGVYINKKLHDDLEGYPFKYLRKQLQAPTQSLLQRWIREKYGFLIIIDWMDEVYGYYYKILDMNINTEGDDSKGFKTLKMYLDFPNERSF